MALDVNKVTLCWPNHIENSTITGGSYTAPRPVINAKNSVFSKKARTVDLLAASTQFDVNLVKPRPIHVVSIAAHNFSATSTARVRVYSDVGQTDLLHDSGIVNIWPSVYSSAQLEWEYNNFWFGRIDEDGRAEFTPLFTYFLPNVEIGQSVKVEIFDDTNSDGYVEFGRVLISDAWQPLININYGVSFGYENTTIVDRADDTTEYFDIKAQKRTMNFVFGRLNEQEAFTRLYSLQRNQGVSKEILISFNLEQTAEGYQKTFIGRASQLDPISQPFIENYEGSLSLLEIT